MPTDILQSRAGQGLEFDPGFDDALDIPKVETQQLEYSPETSYISEISNRINEMRKAKIEGDANEQTS